MVYCPNCGAENPDENEFCGKCGTKLAKLEAPKKKPPAKKPLKKKVSKPTPTDKNKIYAGIGIAIVAIGIIGAYFLLGGGGNSVEVTFTPSTVHVGDVLTTRVRVTNNESGIMILSSVTVKFYRNGELMGSDTPSVGGAGWDTTIPPGETRVVWEITDTMEATVHMGGKKLALLATGGLRFQ